MFNSVSTLTESSLRPERLGLQARALASLEYALNGAVAIMTLRPEDFSRTGGETQDVSELVNMPMVVRTVRVSILLTETSPGNTKLSFRSKPDVSGAPNTAPVDMNQLAQHFGGGGHTHAAGAHVKMSADDARAALVTALDQSARKRAS